MLSAVWEGIRLIYNADSVRSTVLALPNKYQTTPTAALSMALAGRLPDGAEWDRSFRREKAVASAHGRFMADW